LREVGVTFVTVDGLGMSRTIKDEPYIPGMDIEKKDEIKYEPSPIKRKLFEDISDIEIEEVDEVPSKPNMSKKVE
jgi:hypothetical protein